MAVNARIGVVTVTYNSGGVIEEFIESIRHQNHANFRLYVTDNRSSDDTVGRLHRRLDADPRVELIINPDNRGVAAGNNQGIRAALRDGCEFVLLINNDTVFGPDLLSQLLLSAESLRADLLVPKITFADPPYRIWCAGGGFNRKRAYSTVHFGEGEEDRGQFNTAKSIDYAPTCCMLIRTAVFKKVGLMDENYFVYHDDSDFVLRARRSGHQLWYSPAPILRHKVSALTGGALSDFSVLHGTRGKVYFIRKNFPPPASWIWLGVFGLMLFARLFSSDYGRRRVGLLKRGWTEGMKLRVTAGTRCI